MKNRPLTAYLLIVTALSAIVISAAMHMDEKGRYIASLYMLVPAGAAIIARLFLYEKGFSDADIKLGRLGDYIKFWAVALGVTLASFVAFTLLGAVGWDFSGGVFLGQLSEQMALSGRDINDLPKGLTPTIMLWLFFAGGLTIFNVLPGIVTGFGEEFGWRGFMFPRLYEATPRAALIIGGLIWFLWHLPLMLIIPPAPDHGFWLKAADMIILSVGSVCTFTFLTYVYARTGNILVASLAHITLNNSARAFSYFVTVRNQTLANLGLTVTMALVVLFLWRTGRLGIFRERFGGRGRTSP